MKQYRIETEKGDVIVTSEDIDDIVCTALEGGVTATWCGKVDVDGEYLGEFAHEQISRGGSLFFYDIETGDKFTLTNAMFFDGLWKYINESRNVPFLVEEDGDTYSLDCSEIDAEIADMIIQYAMFDEQVYG